MKETKGFSSRLLILSGFSGSGKDVVMQRLISEEGWERVVTHNANRGPRPNEKHGVDYYFVSEEEFKQMVEDGKMLETAPYGETLKGTSKSEFFGKLETGKNVVWRIEATAAARVDEIFKEKLDEEEAERLLERTVVVFLRAESEEILFERAKNRNNDGNLKVIKDRIEEDRKMWEELADKFKHVVINREGKLDETVEAVKTIAMGLLKQEKKAGAGK